MNVRKLHGIIVLCFCSAFIVQCTAQKDLPPEIAGRWTTDNPSFRSEYIEVSRQAIVYGSESEGGFTYRIKEVKSEKGSLYKSTMFRIYCVGASGDENIFTLIYTPDNGGTIRQKSTQDTIWKRNRT
jgi:hypothetical protein